MPPLAHAIGEDKICTQHSAKDTSVGIVPEYAKWRFEPPGSTEWLHFNGPALCRKLINDANAPQQPRILFVGDSRSREQFWALLIHLSPYTLPVGEARMKVQPADAFPLETGHGGKNARAWARGGQLWMQQMGSLNLESAINYDFHFREHAQWLQSFDVVLLALPFNFHSTKEGDILDFWKRTMLPWQKLLVRTSSIGHEHTGVLYNHTLDAKDIWPIFQSREQRAPFQSPEEVIAYLGLIKGHGSWNNMFKSNEAMIPSLEQRGFIVADYYWISAMMWDRHRDPLHYCIPGPVDRWNDIFFNFVMRGHIRDFQGWSKAFSKAVQARGGVHNVDGIGFDKDKSGMVLEKGAVDEDSGPEAARST